MFSDEPFVLTLWTSDPVMAAAADAAGVDRVGIDLERLGKQERQRGLGTWISPHEEHQLEALAPVLSRALLFARLNPINPDSAREVESVLSRGAQVLMLPMVMQPREVEEVVRLVGSRATVVLLVEHVEALKRLREIVSVPGVEEVHIGLNDLALSLGMRNRWMCLAGEMITEAAATVHEANLRFGLGGIGRAGDNDLPVPADLIYAEYARTGASAAIISRSFFREGGCELAVEIRRSRDALRGWRARTREELDLAHAELGLRAAKAMLW